MDILEFLKKARLEKISLGITQNELEKYLGIPEQVSEDKKQNSIIWGYENVQYTFHNSKLIAVIIYFIGRKVSYQIESNIATERSHLSTDIYLHELLFILNLNKIEFQINKHNSYHSQLCLELSNSIRIYYNLEDGYLDKIILSDVL